MDQDSIAIRAVVRGQVQAVGFRDAALRRARTLGVMGWVRNGEEGNLSVHAEGAAAAVDALVAFLRSGPPLAHVSEVTVERVPLEGHEQFAIRGVSAGGFVVFERRAGRPRFELGLEVAGITRSWALAREPVLDPAVKGMAIELDDRPTTGTQSPTTSGERTAISAQRPTPSAERTTISAERTATGDEVDHGEVNVWDRGAYEQGGRVPWPEALTRGHAVLVLRGQRLRGGFALQRTRPGPPAQWLLIKRRDEYARSDPQAMAPRTAHSDSSAPSGETRPAGEKVP